MNNNNNIEEERKGTDLIYVIIDRDTNFTLDIYDNEDEAKESLKKFYIPDSVKLVKITRSDWLNNKY